MIATWTKLANGQWGVKVALMDDERQPISGEILHVRRRNGDVVDVRIDAVVTSRREVVYTLAERN